MNVMEIIETDPDAFVVYARRLAWPDEPVVKTASRLGLSRQGVYRALDRLAALGISQPEESSRRGG